MPDSRRFTCVAAAALALTLAAGLPAPAHAQPGQGTQSVDREARQLLDDFAHFVFIRNDELAASYGQALLDLNLTPMEFVAVVEDDPRLRDRFEETTRRALVIDRIEPIAAELRSLYEEGQLERARNPEQIARNIQLLTDNPRARMLARERLSFAGEYAVPQLLQVLMARADQVLESEVQRLLIEMRSRAVMPLAAALGKTDEETQRRIAFIMGQMGLRTALPYLYELLETESLNRDTRRVVERAIDRIHGGPRTAVSAAGLFLDLAESYYREQASLTQFPGESHQLVWEYDPGFGLFPTPVRTEVYHEARAMQLARRALGLGADDQAASALWLAANFSREIDSPAEYENPLYPSDRRGATYYAVASGPSMTARVLDRGLRDRDTPLIRRAIAAMRTTAGAGGDWSSNPLTQALSYPDRRVQYDAALAIAEARPSASFRASDRVVPTLAAAIREADERFALVIATQLEDQQELATRLRDAGYTVLAPAANLASVQSDIAEAPGVDLIVSRLSAGATEQLISDARAESKLRVTPLLGLVAGAPAADLASRYAADEFVGISRAGIDRDAFLEAVDRLTLEATGPAMTSQNAQRYAAEALSALRDLAIAGSDTLDVSVAARPLVSVFQEDGPLTLVIADVLASLDSAEAQRALIEAGFDASGQERVSLMRLVGRSVREHGSMLEQRHIDRLLELAGDQSLPENQAVAVAALVGSLDLQSAGGAELILRDAQRESAG